MSNYYDNTKQVLPLDILLPYLVSKTAAGVHGFKIVSKTYSSDEVCPVAANQDIEDLWRRAIAIGDDNKPALRVCITEKANGTGLTAGAIAAASIPNETLLSLCFVETSDGEIALNIYSIT